MHFKELMQAYLTFKHCLLLDKDDDINARVTDERLKLVDVDLPW